MRSLLSLCVLVALASGVGAAERFTATNGQSYTKAADGHYYPSEYVRADGSVRDPNVPEKIPATRSACGCVYCTCTPHQSGKPWDSQLNCGSYVCPANTSGRPMYLPVPQAYYLPQSCPNGRCQLNGK